MRRGAISIGASGDCDEGLRGLSLRLLSQEEAIRGNRGDDHGQHHRTYVRTLVEILQRVLGWELAGECEMAGW